MWLFVNNQPCFGYIQITTLNNKNTFGAPYILNISDLENLFKENFPSPRRKTLMKKLLPLVCLVSRGGGGTPLQ